MDQKRKRTETNDFFCQQIDANQDAHRRSLEKELGSQISFSIAVQRKNKSLFTFCALWKKGLIKFISLLALKGRAVTRRET